MNKYKYMLELKQNEAQRLSAFLLKNVKYTYSGYLREHLEYLIVNCGEKDENIRN